MLSSSIKPVIMSYNDDTGNNNYGGGGGNYVSRPLTHTLLVIIAHCP